ncbi:hypothetical protein BC831DRAFT_170890 [Entophlyctis helioformis]|nr:hypothetical protein BC831DRAFT_170890 [Entophlyctis helioformis]
MATTSTPALASTPAPAPALAAFADAPLADAGGQAPGAAVNANSRSKAPAPQQMQMQMHTSKQASRLMASIAPPRPAASAGASTAGASAAGKSAQQQQQQQQSRHAAATPSGTIAPAAPAPANTIAAGRRAPSLNPPPLRNRLRVDDPGQPPPARLSAAGLSVQALQTSQAQAPVAQTQAPVAQAQAQTQTQTHGQAGNVRPSCAADVLLVTRASSSSPSPSSSSSPALEYVPVTAAAPSRDSRPPGSVSVSASASESASASASASAKPSQPSSPTNMLSLSSHRPSPSHRSHRSPNPTAHIHPPARRATSNLPPSPSPTSPPISPPAKSPAMPPATPSAPSAPSSFSAWPVALTLIPLVLSALVGHQYLNWTEPLVLVFVSFHLYMTLRAPWELYSMARALAAGSRRHLRHLRPTASAQDAAAADQGLERLESRLLLLFVASPILGGLGLYLATRYIASIAFISELYIVLFVLAASVMPLFHLISLVKDHAASYKTELEFPASQVDSLKARLSRLELEIASLRQLIPSDAFSASAAASSAASSAAAATAAATASQASIESVALVVGRHVKRIEKKHGYYSCITDDRIALLEHRLRQLEETADRAGASQGVGVDHASAPYDAVSMSSNGDRDRDGDRERDGGPRPASPSSSTSSRRKVRRTNSLPAHLSITPQVQPNSQAQPPHQPPSPTNPSPSHGLALLSRPASHASHAGHAPHVSRRPNLKTLASLAPDQSGPAIMPMPTPPAGMPSAVSIFRIAAFTSPLSRLLSRTIDSASNFAQYVTSKSFKLVAFVFIQGVILPLYFIRAVWFLVRLYMTYLTNSSTSNSSAGSSKNSDEDGKNVSSQVPHTSIYGSVVHASHLHSASGVSGAGNTQLTSSSKYIHSAGMGSGGSSWGQLAVSPTSPGSVVDALSQRSMSMASIASSAGTAHSAYRRRTAVANTANACGSASAAVHYAYTQPSDASYDGS